MRHAGCCRRVMLAVIAHASLIKYGLPAENLSKAVFNLKKKKNQQQQRRVSALSASHLDATCLFIGTIPNKCINKPAEVQSQETSYICS